MPPDKNDQLDRVISKIHKRWGSQAIGRSSKQLNGAVSSIASGFPELDDALGIGGIPRGRISELLGTPASGMTTLALTLLGQAQMVGGTAVYIDIDRTFDPTYAISCGVFLEQMTLVHPHTAEGALDMLPDIIHNGGFDLIICDMPGRIQLGDAISRKLASTLGRLLAPLSRRNATLLFLTALSAVNDRVTKDGSHYPRQGILPHYTTLRLLFQRDRWLYRQRDVFGCETSITVIKNKLSAPGRQARITLAFHDTAGGPDQ